MPTISVKITDEQMKKLNDICYVQKINQSSIIRHFIDTDKTLDAYQLPKKKEVKNVKGKKTSAK